MSKAGAAAGRIAGELYERGIKNGLGRTYTTAMIEGFLRYTGLENERLAGIQKKKRLNLQTATDRYRPPLPFPKVSGYGKDAEPIADPLPRVRMVRPWPLHTDFRPDNLNVRD